MAANWATDANGFAIVGPVGGQFFLIIETYPSLLLVNK